MHMFQIDIRTAYLGYIIVNVVNLIVIGAVYYQIRNRFPGTLLIFISFILSASGNALVFFRGTIPEWISISVSNTLVVTSTVILLIAFEKFVNRKGIQFQNYLLILVFSIVHTYFAFVEPSLVARNLNLSVTYVLLSSQIAFLLLYRTPAVMRKITRPVGFVFCAVIGMQVFRVFYILHLQHEKLDYFQAESAEAIFLLLWEVTLMLLAFSITLMYNKRLIMDVNAQEEKFSKSFHAAPFIIILSKLSDGKIFEVNNGMQIIAGYKPTEIISLKTTELNLWKRQEDRNTFVAELKSKGEITEKEYEFCKKSGEIFIGLISATVIEINDEQCIISVITDITARKDMEMKLVKSEVSLRELNSTKDKFFSIIAHDLKSPFNGIIGFSEVIREQVLKQDYQGIAEYSEIINKSSHQAMNLLSNLMEWSRSQTGRISFHPEYIDMVMLIKSCFELLKLSALQKSITLTHNIPHDLIVPADKAMVETVLRNLISNAIKFTPRGGNVTVVAEKKQNNCLVLVSDSGMGIEKSNIGKLFRIDGNFSEKGTDNESGTGLGLIICKDFIDKHNGKIWVESEYGHGSKFYFSLPIT